MHPEGHLDALEHEGFRGHAYHEFSMPTPHSIFVFTGNHFIDGANICASFYERIFFSEEIHCKQLTIDCFLTQPVPLLILLNELHPKPNTVMCGSDVVLFRKVNEPIKD